MAKGWSREFDDPIELPRGRQLVMLEDAKLPKAEYEAPEWQAAMEAPLGRLDHRRYFFNRASG
jgi:hypothetical protein